MNNVISFNCWLLGGRYKQSLQEYCLKQHIHCQKKSNKKFKFEEVILHNIGFTIAYLCTVEPIVDSIQTEILTDTNSITKSSQLYNITLFNSNMFMLIFFDLGYSFT